MSNIPAEGHPGHALLHLTGLPPDEAIGAMREQLLADFDSRRTDGVLISSGEAFIGADAYLDHGVESILNLLALALASSIDSGLAENNFGERTRPMQQIVDEAFWSPNLYLNGLVEHRIRERYLATLIGLEEERRRQEAEEADLD